METIEFECDSCHASGKIVYDLGRPYQVSNCPFCGELIDIEEDIYEEKYPEN